MRPDANFGEALVLDDVSLGYGGLPVVRNVSMTVEPGEVVALLGANGAGKTTTLSAIAGLIRPLSGSIRLGETSTAKTSTAALARAGVCLVPEQRALFADLTTRENLRVATQRRGAAEREEQVLALLPELTKCLSRKAGMLSGGEQQMLAVGRAIINRPRVLAVDEMSLGLAPVIVERLIPVLAAVAREFSTAVLIVEQHVQLALAAASRAYVLAHGRIVLSGSAEHLLAHEELIAQSYLGTVAAEPGVAAAEPPAPSRSTTSRKRTKE